MQTGAPPLRVKVPCDDERDFYARLADRIAANGLRVPLDQPRLVGTRVSVALEFRNGGMLSGEGVIDAHVRLDERPGINVRFLRLDPPGELPAPPQPRTYSRPAPPAAAPKPTPAPPSEPSDSPLESPFESPPEAGSRAEDDGPFANVVDEALPGERPAFPESLTGSAEIIAQVRQRIARVERAAIAMGAVALTLALGGYAIARHLGTPPSPDAAVAAHVEAADRLLSEGRLTGEHGALEHLLAAKRLRPADPATRARLVRVADVLESLGARALERGDAAVASIHLASAKLAAPDRQSIRAKLERLDRQRSPRASP